MVLLDVLFVSVIQREDWRLRPLSAEMTEYARNDVHYLLYIAGCLASELESKTSGMNSNFSFWAEMTISSPIVFRTMAFID